MKQLKKAATWTFMVFCFFIASAIFSLPSREEILEELTSLRTSHPSLDRNFDNTARNFMDEITEQKILNQTTGKWEYIKKYLMFWFTALYTKVHPMILITHDNAPLLMELIDDAVEKMGLTEKPLIYLCVDPEYFNMSTNGFFHSMSAIVIGEKIVREMPDAESIAFIIAHEVAHIKNRDVLKSFIFTLILSNLICNIVKRYGSHKIIEIPYVCTIMSDILIYSTSFGLIWGYLSRAMERKADKDAARAIGAKAGVKGFNVLAEKWEPRLKHDYAILWQAINSSPLNQKWLYKIRITCAYYISLTANYCKSFFDMHPPATERFTYLEQMAADETSSKANC